MENIGTNNSLIFIAMLIISEIILLGATYYGWRFTAEEQNKTIDAWEHAPNWWPLRDLSLQYYKSKLHFWVIRLMPLLFLIIVSVLLFMILLQAVRILS